MCCCVAIGARGLLNNSRIPANDRGVDRVAQPRWSIRPPKLPAQQAAGYKCDISIRARSPSRSPLLAVDVPRAPHSTYPWRECASGSEGPLDRARARICMHARAVLATHDSRRLRTCMRDGKSGSLAPRDFPQSACMCCECMCYDPRAPATREVRGSVPKMTQELKLTKWFIESQGLTQEPTQRPKSS